MSQPNNGETPRGLARIKVVSAALGVTVESLLGLQGATDFFQSMAGAAVAAGAENVISSRLSKRQRRNVETVAHRAIVRAGQRCVDGEVPREDEFLSTGPSSFEEAVDGALIAAQRNYESKKLRHLGNLVASFAFDTSVNGVTANWCIRMAESLSWAQYVLLALANEDVSKSLRVPLSGGLDRTVDDPTAWSVWEDWEDLHARRLVGQRYDDLHYRRNNLEMPATPLGWSPVPGGRLLIRLMELDTISTEDRNVIYAAMVKAAETEP